MVSSPRKALTVALCYVFATARAVPNHHAGGAGRRATDLPNSRNRCFNRCDVSYLFSVLPQALSLVATLEALDDAPGSCSRC